MLQQLVLKDELKLKQEFIIYAHTEPVFYPIIDRLILESYFTYFDIFHFN